MSPVIDRLTAGEHVGVVVLINKYDGVDLPHDACRLLIVDGIPTPLSGAEQREAAALTGSTTFQAQRVASSRVVYESDLVVRAGVS